MTAQDAGKLYIVATPIGNLGDITYRAVEILRQVDYIAAEDTRHSGRLLQHFNITTPQIAYHDHSDAKRVQKISDLLHEGKSVALISDAGTPLISDPGYPLVTQMRDQQIDVVPIPGPCAFIAALSASGLPSDHFSFDGFLPAKSSARLSVLAALRHETRTLIFYESTHRLLDSLQDMVTVMGEERHAVIARELTKTYETILSGTLTELLDRVEQDPNQQRGEFVILVGGYKPDPNTLTLGSDAETTMAVLLESLPLKQAAAIAARLTGLKKRDLYQWALDQK
jgi:16S rRNA (cytidine1402-2'-O)-methyltransferase